MGARTAQNKCEFECVCGPLFLNPKLFCGRRCRPSTSQRRAPHSSLPLQCDMVGNMWSEHRAVVVAHTDASGERTTVGCARRKAAMISSERSSTSPAGPPPCPTRRRRRRGGGTRQQHSFGRRRCYRDSWELCRRRCCRRWSSSSSAGGQEGALGPPS